MCAHVHDNMFDILLIIVLALFIFGYILVALAPKEDIPTPDKPSIQVRGEAQDEMNPREAIYARIRQRLKKPEE